MQEEELQALLDKLTTLPAIEKREPNMFSIGARGHYENPVSDVLAFFLWPEAEHGLGNRVLEALLSCLPQGQALDASLVCAPEREASTEKGNRIDMLLESDEWVLVLENKIRHQQNNPFEDYQDHLKTEAAYRHKDFYYVVLSPEGKAPAGWHGIAYKALLTALSECLGKAFITGPVNKWLVLLREFILHLESLMMKSAIPETTERFVLENLDQIQEMLNLKNNVIKSVQEEGLRYLENHFADQGYEISTRLNHWYGYPALRYAFSHWVSASDVVLYLNATPGETFDVRTYACNLTSEALREEAKACLNHETYEAPWNEGQGKIICFQVLIDQKNVDKHALFAEIARQMAVLDDFELTKRGE